MSDATFQLRKQAEAAKRLVVSLREQGEGEDAEIIETAIEGETSLHEAVSMVVDLMDEEDIFIAGAEAKVSDIQGRIDAAKKRNEMRRALLEQALVTSEAGKVVTPSYTLFVSQRAPGLIVENEADIPSEFFKAPERPAPKLDKKALLQALKDNRTIPGACLDNGSVSLSMRRK